MSKFMLAGVFALASAAGFGGAAEARSPSPTAAHPGSHFESPPIPDRPADGRDSLFFASYEDAEDSGDGEVDNGIWEAYQIVPLNGGYYLVYWLK